MSIEPITARIVGPRVWFHEGTSMSSRNEDRLVGTVLDDRFHICSKIAAGGFGTIYRATVIASGQQVAIKVMHEEHLSDPSVSARFRREAVAMSSLADPHTVTTHELGQDPYGTRFIVMELLRGESLQDRFAATGPMHWRKVLTIIKDVCSSLAEAHALGIVHRDLKPANIFLANEPTPDFVKVLDFGIAKISRTSNMHDGSEITRIGQAIGTLEYMAPEQLIGGAVDQRTDLYTLGVVAYELLTGQRPFHEATGATSLVTALMTRRPVPPSTVARGPLPRELDGTLLRCLEREPMDRYQSVGELVEVIERMLASKSDIHTTQQLWLRSPSTVVQAQAVFAERGDDELTWIDARPPFEPDVFAEVPRISPPRGWRAAGTNAPNTTLPGFEDTALARPQLPRRIAEGSSPIIGSEPYVEPTTAATTQRASAMWIVLVGLLLAATGVGLGVLLASMA
jgi:serine/threonine protein kinase